MGNSNFIQAARERIRHAVAECRKRDGKAAITVEKLTGIYFELNPGVDEIHTSGISELRALAADLDVTVVSESEPRAAGSAYSVF